MSALSFTPGQLYRRRDLHATWGGSYQSGISASRVAPVIFLFTGEAGPQHGYHDGWQPDGTFQYSGEGQKGDMTFTRGNLAIRAHEDDGRALHLFEKVGQPSGHVRYVGRMEYRDHRMDDGVPDGVGEPRRAIVFILRRAEEPATDADLIPYDNYHDEFPPPDDITIGLRIAASARLVAEDSTPYSTNPTLATFADTPTVRAIRTFVLRRAGSSCEGCGSPAPFHRVDGSPYLEAHDTRRLSDHEFDDPAHAIALCPNCHRRIHHGEDGPAYDAHLRALLMNQPG